MKDVLLTVGAVVVIVAGVYGGSLFIGNGRCFQCGRYIAPWSAYCREHLS